MFILTFILGWAAGHYYKKYNVEFRFAGGFNILYTDSTGAQKTFF